MDMVKFIWTEPILAKRLIRKVVEEHGDYASMRSGIQSIGVELQNPGDFVAEMLVGSTLANAHGLFKKELDLYWELIQQYLDDSHFRFRGHC